MKLTERQRLILYRNITATVFLITIYAVMIFKYLVKVGIIVK